MSNILTVKQVRKIFTNKTTVSDITINGVGVCFFLEDKDRNLNQGMSPAQTAKIKVPAQTAIGYGRYEIDITLSQRFGVYLPILLGVVGFVGIRQHKGNKAEDTEGCQLPGLKRSNDAVMDSTGAFYTLLQIYLTHLTMDTVTAARLVVMHRNNQTKEFELLFKKSRVSGQKIFIEISK